MVAHAEEVEVKPYKVTIINFVETNINGEYKTYMCQPITITPNNNTVEKAEFTVSDNANQDGNTIHTYYEHTSQYYIKYNDASVMMDKDKNYTVKLNNIYYSTLIQNNYGSVYARNHSNIKIKLVYDDGTTETITSYTVSHVTNTPTYNIEFNATPTANVSYIQLDIISKYKEHIPDEMKFISYGAPIVKSYAGEFNGDDKYQFSMEVQSEEAGLLSGLLNWIKQIKSKIDDMFSNVSSGFSNVVSSISSVVTNIIELPSKLWNLISEGLQRLFVPSQSKMAELKEDWEQLLSERFGALYESGEVINSVLNNITTAAVSTVSEEGIINFPKVDLSAYNIPFEFGGYEVDIKPKGFDFLITICKRVISISCTLVFINTLRKRYESVVHG